MFSLRIQRALVDLALLTHMANDFSYLFLHKHNMVTFIVDAMDSSSERNRFLVVTQMGNLLCISSQKE
jgi:hypothetical protein